jgi:hypothetical protein
MALLSKVYEQKSAARDQQALAVIQRISPVAWQHVNLFGLDVQVLGWLERPARHCSVLHTRA